ncbi:hypothetical protein AUK40_02535 [Candidatus Wirthbacteria bacterium CG2_30_54_11]|uniref:Uncharacterized protein n=1 Tax=Candidatus Wirthbacteria bacterium CG2_30_54_11 TaxID=1817892 RepID=A0A1J5J2R8_9BACT|nr:MAG: hypothetical protein AUK40_02535 [Candidatus Wirthbacteria bacterium CG2_30_54_11]
MSERNHKNGFSVMEVLVAAAMLGVSLVGIWSIFIFSTTQVAVARARTVANNIANEQIEIMRNMPYEDIGTTTGFPHGDIPATQTITRNGLGFSVQTYVRYFDSAADGTVSASSTGKHVHFLWGGCGWEPTEAQILRLDFYNDSIVVDLDFQNYYHGNNFNWSGSVTVDGEDQHFHLTAQGNDPCPTLSLQTQNVEAPFRLYVDGVLIVTYTGPDVFTPGAGVTYTIIGQGAVVPADLYPNDYLHAEVQVCWTRYQCPVAVVMSTFIAQKGAETASDTGVLKIEVLNADGQGIVGANIHIENSGVGLSPIDEVTDINGLRVIPILTPDVEGYEVTVTKSGYSTDRTLAATPQNPHPTQPHLTVQAATISEPTFAIDLVSQLHIDVIKMDDTAGDGIQVTVTGGKTIGVTPTVYKYPDTNFIANSAGRVELTDIEWDTYTLVADLPTGDSTKTVTVSPGTDETIVISPHTLRVTVRDNAGSQPVQEGASVLLTYDNDGSSTTLLTDSSGRADFSSLRTGAYSIDTSLSSYISQHTDITVTTGSNSQTIYLIHN